MATKYINSITYGGNEYKLVDNSSGYIKDAGVTSFNGNTGAITYTPPVTSVNGETGAVVVSVPEDASEIVYNTQGSSFFPQSADTVQDAIDKLGNDKQNTLVSGTNIKTVNNNSLLGNGNVSVGTLTGVKIDGTSIVSNNVANITTSSSHPYSSSNPLATLADIGAAGGGTVTSVGLTNTGGLTISGSPITSSGNISVGHINSVNTTLDQAVYPITIDENGHISSYGAAVPELYLVTATITDYSDFSGVTDKSSTDIFNAAAAGKLPVIKISLGPTYMVAQLAWAESGGAVFVYEDQDNPTYKYARLIVTNSTFAIVFSAGFVENESARIVGTSPITVSGTGEIANNSTVTISLGAYYGDTENPYGRKPSNQVLASPDNANGLPGFRSLVSADIPALGNIKNSGALQTNDIAIASGDKLVVTDLSDSSKVARSSISFDTTDTSSYLRHDGTWGTPSGGGTSTDVQINGTSITSSNVANIITNSAYNATSNKIATMDDVCKELWTGSLQNGSSVNLDCSGYTYLRVWVHCYAAVFPVYVDLTTTPKYSRAGATGNTALRGSATAPIVNTSNSVRTYAAVIELNATKTTLWARNLGYFSGTSWTAQTNADYYVFRIEGYV